MNLKQILEMVSTGSFGGVANCVGTRTTDGGFASPSLGPQHVDKKKWKRKKAAKVNDLTKGVLGGVQRRPTVSKITPTIWEPTNPKDVYSDWQKDALKEVANRIKGKIK